MADIITGTVSGYVNNNPEVTLAAINDTRRENSLDHGRQDLENMKGFDRINADVLGSSWKNSDVTKDGTYSVTNAVKDARFEIASRIGETTESTKRDMTAYFIASTQAATENAREIAGLKSAADMTAQKLALDIAAGANNAAFAAQLASEKIGTAQALATALLGRDVLMGQNQIERVVVAEGAATRALINDLKYHDLNRHLVERNTELVEAVAERREYRYRADQNQFQGQFAALQNQIQAFGSNLQDTRNSLVNFGSMSKGAGNQSATSNSV